MRRQFYAFSFFMFLTGIAFYWLWYLPRRSKIRLICIFTIICFIVIGPSTAFLSQQDIIEYRSLKETYVWLTPTIYIAIARANKFQEINDKNLICALFQAESGDYCENDLDCMLQVRSYAGAIGIGQVMPYHAENSKNLERSGYNIDKSAWYLKECLTKSNGNFKEACRMYNAGLRNKRKSYKNWAYVAKILNYYIIHQQTSAVKTSF